MARLQTFLVALILFVSVSLAVVPVQVPPDGKARGFISDLGYDLTQPSGDWLTSTLCYCHSPVRAKETNEYEKAHVFQFEYYNYHNNATYVNDHMCLSRARNEGDQCILPNVEGDNYEWYREGHWVCKKYERTEEEKIWQANSKRSTRRGKRYAPHMTTPPVCAQHCAMGPFAPDPEEKDKHPNHDKVCFGVARDFFGEKEMELKFNRQRRKMDKPNEAGGVKTDYHEVREHCEDMCQKCFKMPADMEINDKRAGGGSRQVVYTRLDDMCDNCR